MKTARGNSHLKLFKLARMMNGQTDSPLPVTPSLLRVFDAALSPEETDFLVRIGTSPLSRADLSARTGLAGRNFDAIFESCVSKGTIWSEESPDGEEIFSLAPIMLGWFEVHLCGGQRTPEKREFARRLSNLFDSWKKFNFPPLRALRNIAGRFSSPRLRIGAIDPGPGPKGRTITIDRELLPPATQVMSAPTVRGLIETYGGEDSIALVHCFCRQWRSMEGSECRLSMPAESCIVLGKFSAHAVKYGFGRRISREEAALVIEDTRRRGAVHMVWHERDDMNRGEIAICNCCWDCCGVLGSYNRGISSLHFKTSYHAVTADADPCTGCGLCVKACPVGAVRLADKKPVVTKNRCIGCGQCALQCPRDVIRLVPEEREVLLPLLKRSRARIREY
jgi:ferredoxin